MILRGFKEKSNKKYLNRLLAQNRSGPSSNVIESLGVIFCVDEFIDFECFKKLAEQLNIKPNRIKIIAYSTKKNKSHLHVWSNCYTVKDLGRKGHVKSIGLNDFLNEEFDVLISYYQANIVALKLLTAKSKSGFKIGILQDDERLNDLIIKTQIKEFNLFKDEVFKYLTILKKIKNEQ